MPLFEHYTNLGRSRGGRPINPQNVAGRIGTTPTGVRAPITGVASPTRNYLTSTPQPHTTSNPELQGTAQSPYSQLLGGLTKPIDIETGRTSTEEQDIFNRMRTRIQSMGKLAETQYTTGMGTAGFREGESGLVGRGLGEIRRQTGAGLAGAAKDVAISSREKRFGERAELANLNLQRLIGGGSLALQGEEGAQNRMMQLLSLMAGSEQARWQPYWSGVAGVAGS